MPQLKDRHFHTVADLIQARIGIQIPETKRTMVEGRLRKRMRALDLDSLKAYGDHLFDDGHLAEEFVHIIDCVTTNKTDFFREPAHFEHLRDDLVPLLCRRRGGNPRLKIWSAAASTGAEAYTLAMILQDMIVAGYGFSYAILGTDISTEVLRVAAEAIYPEEMLVQIPPAFRRRYVMTSRDPARKLGRIVPELRSHVHFQRLNLMDASYAVDQDVDVIFCRNVLIYFDKDTQKAVLGRLAQHLRPGGFLIVGHSESMAGTGVPGLEQVSSTIFRRARDLIQ
ncbi:chemotaxis protein methyltransferase CheR/two-component system, chemotaxis family, response regulator CheB [Methylobacterium phyllostachyos]|uniref:Chemotaxis protein methyltransferase n=1 Tax=Methylobacterium phyllostachyos TaxID=582672 RepID=A0A1H0LCQ3_9HYPH|nr:protein-glutamate O-methyltransferase [Methylobacterium phyllostachyos]SDO66024.1 chemotaxis protein methyltransferase CheR/two-component system, chemotaxis family, response regulator CheB [Methylobacterium phyllostachyos]